MIDIIIDAVSLILSIIVDSISSFFSPVFYGIASFLMEFLHDTKDSLSSLGQGFISTIFDYSSYRGLAFISSDFIFWVVGLFFLPFVLKIAFHLIFAVIESIKAG